MGGDGKCITSAMGRAGSPGYREHCCRHVRSAWSEVVRGIRPSRPCSRGEHRIASHATKRGINEPHVDGIDRLAETQEARAAVRKRVVRSTGMAGLFQFLVI